MQKTMATIFLLFLLLLPDQAKSQDLTGEPEPEPERDILLSLKQQWGNPPSLGSWNSHTFHCEWPEVECNSGSVTALHLATKAISGLIPDDIKNLSNLIWLDLSHNFFSGTIPMGMFQMHKLQNLLLSDNTLSGHLPAVMNMSKLQELKIDYNHLNGAIPETLGKLTTLITLDLSNNQLSGNVVENVFHLRADNIWLCSNKFFGKIPFELLDHRYKCVDHYNLCSNYGANSLASCPSSLCSDRRTKPFLECEPKSKRYFVITIVEAAGCGVVGFAILYYMARKCWLKKHETIVATSKKIWRCSSSMKEAEKWRMTAFQRLNFNEIDILPGLTDENLIGNGGSGKVYRVFINRASTTVAVKSISNSRKPDHRLEKEFLAEIRTLGTIRHSNIVKLFCCISGKELRLLVYQYFENKSLDQWLHGNKRQIPSVSGNINPWETELDWPKRLHVTIGAAQGLCYMHHDTSPPVIHRDIKSSNILLDSEFNAKIADFGLAKLLSTRHGGTEIASAVAGTFGYIAPEYASATKVNSKSDVYSFGVVLLELTTGREAVTRGEHMNLAQRARILNRDTTSLIHALDDGIKDSRNLDQIITVFRLGVICTAKSPSNRPSMKDCDKTANRTISKRVKQHGFTWFNRKMVYVHGCLLVNILISRCVITEYKGGAEERVMRK